MRHVNHEFGLDGVTEFSELSEVKSACKGLSTSYEISLAELGIPYAELPDVRMHRNLRVDGHPNDEGHHLMTHHLTEYLTPIIAAVENR